MRTPITGATLEACADFAAFMLSRTPEQLLGADVAARLAPADLFVIRMILQRVYLPALRLAGRA